MLVFIIMAFNLGLIAFAVGVLLLVWALRKNETGSTIATIAGAIISILALSIVIYLGSNMAKIMMEPTPVQGAPAHGVPPPPMPKMPPPEAKKP